MKTILVPTDFTPASVAATKFAQGLATKFKSTIVLLHVVEAVDEASFNIEGEASATGSIEDRLFNMKMIEKARKDLSTAKSLLSDAGIDVRSLLRVGDAYHGMQAIITEQKADLVIMGTEGDTGNSHLFIGTNTEKIVRRSSCPVISVNRKTKFESLKSIVWATSLNQEDLNLPPVLKEIINAGNITVHLVRINTPGMFMRDVVSKEKLEAIAEYMKFEKFTINVFNDLEESSGINHFAETVNADLIALSTHGRHGIAQLVNGSIAEGLINHTKRAVLTYLIGAKDKK